MRNCRDGVAIRSKQFKPIHQNIKQAVTRGLFHVDVDFIQQSLINLPAKASQYGRFGRKQATNLSIGHPCFFPDVGKGQSVPSSTGRKDHGGINDR